MTGHTDGGPSPAEPDPEHAGPDAEAESRPDTEPAGPAPEPDAADVTQLMEPPGRTVETADPGARTVETVGPGARTVETAQRDVETVETGDPAAETVEVEHPTSPAVVEAPEPVRDSPADPYPGPAREPAVEPAAETVEVARPGAADPAVVDLTAAEPPTNAPPTKAPPTDPWTGYEDPPERYPVTGGSTVIRPQDEVDGWTKARRRHRRQTLTFVSGLAGVLVLGLLAYMTFLGDISWPFGGKVDVTANLCTRSKPLQPSKITLRVYNGSDRKGLAVQVTRQLQAFGFAVEDTGNDPLEAKLTTPLEIRHGENGVLAAKTTQAYLIGKVHEVVDDRQSESVDVVLSKSFTRVKTRKEVAAALVALTNTLPKNCPPGVTQNGSTGGGTPSRRASRRAGPPRGPRRRRLSGSSAGRGQSGDSTNRGRTPVRTMPLLGRVGIRDSGNDRSCSGTDQLIRVRARTALASSSTVTRSPAQR